MVRMAMAPISSQKNIHFGFPSHPMTMQIAFKETLWKATVTFLHMKCYQSSTTQFVCHFPKTVMTFTIFLIVNVFGHTIFKE